MKALRRIIYLTVLSGGLASLVSSVSAQEQAKGDSGEIKQGAALQKGGQSSSASVPAQTSQSVHDCTQVAELMVLAIQADPGRSIEILKQSIVKSKDCTCELLAVAIRLSDGSEESVKNIVITALENAEDMASAIAECSVIAAPIRIEAIREAFAEVQSNAGSELKTKKEPKQMTGKSSSGKHKAGKPRIGTMIKKLVPGWRSKSKTGEIEDSKQMDGTTEELQMEASNLAKKGEESSRPTQAEVEDEASAEHWAGKDVLSEGSAESSGAEGMQRLGLIPSIDRFAFDYVWPEISTSDMGERPITTSNVPLQWLAYLDNGFDSNVNTAPAGSSVDSYFVGGGVASYFAVVTQDTRFDVQARFGIRYMEDSPKELDKLIYRGHLLANLQHQFSENLRVSNQTGISYDAEPDFLSGETAGFRTDQYVFAYNRLAFGYRWAKHFETRSYYTVSTIQYEDEWLKVQEDRWRHLLGQQFRFLLNGQQAVFLEYRYSQTDFQTVANDSHSHYFIGGMDYEMSSDLKGSLAGGAERRSFERFPDQWQPYAEATLQKQAAERTQLRWGARLGFEDAEIGGFRDRYSFRTGLEINQELSDRLTASLGFFYLHSDFDTGGQGQDVDGYSDDAVMLQLGLSYALLENLDFYLGYDFTQYDSGDALRNYDRHRVRVGLNSRF